MIYQIDIVRYAMTVSYTYDDEENFIYTKGSGVLTDQDLEEFATAMAKDSRIKTGVRELVDLRAVEWVAGPTPTHGFLKHLHIGHTGNFDNREKYEGKKIAIVAPRELLFGLSKYFEVISHIDNAPFKLNVFRTMAEAKEWLHISKRHPIS